ncbi:hypothetical protein IW136_001011 [Coemansia sp. RSA 678]|nr:hypothetical protein IW136_001011 [Coemansia sp. RSA 678]
MSRPTRRHARKASATTAEEILLPAELMSGLTSTLSSPTTLPNLSAAGQPTNALLPLPALEGLEISADKHSPEPAQASLDLAPLFPVSEPGAAVLEDTTPKAVDSEIQTDAADEATSENGHSARPMPERGILKLPQSDDSNGSRWSLWPGAKKWFSGTLLPNARSDMPTFDHGAGIPLGRSSTDDAAIAAAAAALSRTAPSLDFERSTNFVPPLSQERIRSTEFWTNFALELDPSRLKRIRFSMPLIVTEFDPETSRVCDSEDSLVTSLETTTEALRNCLDNDIRADDGLDNDALAVDGLDDDARADDGLDMQYVDSESVHPAYESIVKGAHLDDEPAVHSATDLASVEHSQDDQSSEDQPKHVQDEKVCITYSGLGQIDQTSTVDFENQTNTASDDSGSEHSSQIMERDRQPLQWDVNGLTRRQYRVQEVWEIYERTCRALDTAPLPMFEETLLRHVREDRILGSLNLTGSELQGVHMNCFAEMLDLNFGLVRLELSHCNIDDDAARVLAYSMLCNDSVRYLSLAQNTRLRSDGMRYMAILVRHSKQLRFLDISGVTIRKKSAGYLAAALAGLGANWAFGRGSMHKKDTTCEQISLRALQMNSCGLKPAALAILTSGVRLSPLQHLSLRLNSLGSNTGPILREMLFGDPPQPREPSETAQRRPISVSLHGLSDAQNASDPGALPPGTAGDSPRVSQLRSLDLSQNDLGRAALDLAEGLLWNKNLRSLTLRQNKLQPTAFAPFVECLGINRGLVYLDISRNPVCGPSTAVLEALSQVIGQNQTLRGLFMSATAMTSEGAIALAECLPDLHNLERLDVSENPGIDVAGLMALSASIKLNRSLICVEVTVNTGDDVCAALEQSIAQVCIANMQRLDTESVQSSDAELEFGPKPAHVWTHADAAPECDIPGVVAAKLSGENDRYEYTCLVTDIAAVKRTHDGSEDGDEQT